MKNRRARFVSSTQRCMLATSRRAPANNDRKTRVASMTRCASYRSLAARGFPSKKFMRLDSLTKDEFRNAAETRRPEFSPRATGTTRYWIMRCRKTKRTNARYCSADRCGVRRTSLTRAMNTEAKNTISKAGRISKAAVPKPHTVIE